MAPSCDLSEAVCSVDVHYYWGWFGEKVGGLIGVVLS